MIFIYLAEMGTSVSSEIGELGMRKSWWEACAGALLGGGSAQIKNNRRHPLFTPSDPTLVQRC